MAMPSRTALSPNQRVERERGHGRAEDADQQHGPAADAVVNRVAT
jgi:hypothetical protein